MASLGSGQVGCAVFGNAVLWLAYREAFMSAELLQQLQVLLSLPDKLQALESEIAFLKANMIPKKAWYTKAEVLAMKGFSDALYSRKPWLLPSFGVSRRINAKNIGWSFDEVHAWLPKDADQLEAEYKEWLKVQGKK